jgi:hypothetical protein
MSFARILSFINAYSLWLYAAGLVAVLFSLFEIRQGQRSRAGTIFTLEKEFAATRENRARTVLATAVVWLAVLTVLEFAVVPTQTLPPLREPTPTRLVLEPPTVVALTPTLTRTRIPTRPRPTPRAPTETPTPTLVPPPPCPLPGICITSPTASQVITGQVTIRGTASTDAFQFYKIEYGMGEDPDPWNSIGDVRRTPVVDGTLAVWDTAGFPDGTYKLSLTVVDVSGNFPPPYEVRVIIRH